MAGLLYRLEILEIWIFCSGDSMENWRGWNLRGIPDFGGDGKFSKDGDFRNGSGFRKEGGGII